MINSSSVAGIIQRPTSELLIMTGILSGTKVQILLDPGASISCINSRLAKNLQLNVLRNKTSPLTMPDGHTISSNKVPAVPITIENYKLRIDLYSAPINWDIILGKNWFDLTNPSVDWPNNMLTFFMNGTEHTWKATKHATLNDHLCEKEILQNFMISSMQLKRLVKKKSSKAYVCVLKDNTFQENLEKAISKLTKINKNSILEYSDLFDEYAEYYGLLIRNIADDTTND
ncbi:hypothetical protein HK096_004138, partial [Nowakowskiella sp. JEL0078]